MWVRPNKTATPAGAMATAVGLLLSVAVGVWVALSPILSTLFLVAIAVCLAAFRLPSLAVAAVIIVESLELLLRLAGLDTAGPSSFASVMSVVGAVAATFKPTGARDRKLQLILWAAIGITIIYALTISIGHVPVLQLLAGMRLVITPFMCLIIGLGASRVELRRLFGLAVALMSLSVVAAGAEVYLGVGKLLSSGLEYGREVRTYDGLLRAPGLFSSNYLFGSFAGVVGALAAIAYPGARSARRALRAVIVAVAAAAVFLSIYRVGILILLFSLGLWILFKRSTTNFSLKVAGSALMAAMGATVYLLGLASTDSLKDRLVIWSRLLSENSHAIIGNGLGSAGSASLSRFSSSAVVVDNYFITLYLQLGLLGAFVALLASAVVLVTAVRASHADRIMNAWFVLLAVLFASLFVDFWEYTSAAAIVCFSAAAASHLTRDDTTSAFPDSRASASRR
jgi:hypothetical protein